MVFFSFTSRPGIADLSSYTKLLTVPSDQKQRNDRSRRGSLVHLTIKVHIYESLIELLKESSSLVLMSLSFSDRSDSSMGLVRFGLMGLLIRTDAGTELWVGETFFSKHMLAYQVEATKRVV